MEELKFAQSTNNNKYISQAYNDLAICYYKLGKLSYALENNIIDGSYNAVAPNPVSNKQLTLALAKSIKGNFYIPMHVPGFVLKLLLGEKSIEMLKSTTVSCNKIEQAGFSFNYPTIEKAINELIKPVV